MPNTDKKQNIPQWMQYAVDNDKPRRPDTTNYARCLAMGEFGSGKTYFANTFPKPFFIDTDYGMTTTKQEMTGKTAPGIRLFPGDPVYQTILSFLNDAKSNRSPIDQYETIVLDGLTSLSKLLLYEIQGGQQDPKTGNKAQYDDYGALKIRLASLINAIQSVPFHVVITALTSIERDEVTGSFVGQINTVGSFNKDVGSMVDECYLFEKRRARSNEPGDVVYEAHTEFHPRFAVKSRLQQAAKIPPKIVNPTFASLYGSVYKETK
jgi:hypothetical protein